jgi:DNA gyrase subunit A
LIDILRHAADGTTAKVRLETDLKISDSQANAILAMPMRRLTGLERQKLEADYEALQTRIQELENLLNNRQELLNTLKKELRTLKRKFGDKRRTRIITPTTKKQTQKKSESSEVAEVSSKKSITSEVSSKKTEVAEVKAEPTPTQNLKLFTPQTPPDDAILEITHQGEVTWCSPNSDPNPEIITYRQAIAKQDYFISITDSAKAYPISVSEIPPREIQSISLLSLLSKAAQRDANNIIAHFFPFPDTSTQDLLLLTQQGRIKRLAISELKELTNRGFVLIKLKEGDHLNYVCPTQEGEEALIATSGGRILRFGVTDESIPIMGRNAQGNQGIKLRYGESLVSCLTTNNSQNLLLVSQLGYGKQLPLSTLRLTKLGDVGTQAMQFTSKTDSLAGMVTVEKAGEILLLTNQNRQLKIPVDSVKLWGKDGTGDKLVKLRNEEIITKIFS